MEWQNDLHVDKYCKKVLEDLDKDDLNEVLVLIVKYSFPEQKSEM